MAAAVGLAVGVSLAPGVAQAAIRYFSTTRTVSGTGSVSCPSGWKVVGGGVETLPSDSFSSYSSSEYKLTGSYPTSNGWRASATRTSGTYSSSSGWRFRTSSHSPRVHAICVR